MQISKSERVYHTIRFIAEETQTTSHLNKLIDVAHLRSNSGSVTVQLGISLDVVGVYC